ncbi:MAG: transposase [Clostridia bacterium]|nr:transposase [Clostridia bacterium]
MPKRIYSDEFRLQVVEDYLSGQNGGSRSLSKKYGIHNVTIDRWVKLYKEHGKEGLINCTRTYDGDFKIYVA